MDIIGDKSLRQTWDDLAALYGEKTALLFEDRHGTTSAYSYAQLNGEINRAANLFTSLGIVKGDKVAVQLHNSAEFVFCWFGLAKIGAAIVPLNVHFLHEECAYIIEKCDITTVVVQEEFLPIYQRIEEQNGPLFKHILLARCPADDVREGCKNFTALHAAESPEFSSDVEVTSADTAEILFTSGTTSRPKGVVITHYNLRFAGYYTAWQCALRADDVYLTIMPAFHIDCQCTAMMPTFTTGATMVLVEKYSARRFWSQVCLYKATLTECIPLMVRTLMLQAERPWEKEHCLRDVFFYLCMADEEMDAFVKRFRLTLLTSYGMTETIVGLIGDRPGDKRRWPSIGRAGLCYDARILDEQGQEVPPGTMGEICVKGEPGKTLFKEYYQNPEATQKALSSDGWLRTGDGGYMDEEGFFFFVDRNVNMIKRCGENISCVEIENTLTGHEDIVEAAVIGVPHTMCDETVKAYVVFKDKRCLSEEQIMDYLSARLAKFKLPSVIEVRKTLPRTSTGKVQKYVLKAESLVAAAPSSDEQPGDCAKPCHG